MHRHGYKGRKLGRTKDPRRLLLKNLAGELFQYKSIQTTLPKAKEVIPYAERLITKAKKGGLHNRRQIIARLASRENAHALVDRIASQLSGRQSGYLRLRKLNRRRGDNAQLASVSFVDEIKEVSSDSEQDLKPSKIAAKDKKPVKKSVKKKPASKK